MRAPGRAPGAMPDCMTELQGKGFAMQSRLLRILAALAVALPLGLAGAPAVGPALAEEPPEGVTVTLVAEYKSRVPGIELVRLVRVRIEPGAGFDNVEIKNEEYCELEAGTLTHTNHNTNVTDVLTFGARWAPPKGDFHTVVNTGDVAAEMWVYQLIEEGAEAGRM